MFRLSLGVSTPIGLMSSTSSALLSSPSTISKGLIDDMVASGMLLPWSWFQVSDCQYAMALLLWLCLRPPRALFCGNWITVYHKKMDPPIHPLQMQPILSWSNSDEWHSGTPGCYILLSFLPFWGTLNEVYMYSPFAACVKKIILQDNQKPIIFEVTIIIAHFWNWPIRFHWEK